MYLEFLSKNQINPGGSTLKSDIKLSASICTSKKQLARHPTERKRLKAFSLQTVNSKSQIWLRIQPCFWTVPTLPTTKFLNIFVVLKGMKTFEPRCTTMTYLQPLIWTRHNYLMNKYFLLLQIHHYCKCIGDII